MTIVNFTDCDLSQKQIEDDAVELPDHIKNLVRRLMKFDCIPGLDLIHYRAEMIADIASQYLNSAESKERSHNCVLIGCEYFLMPSLEKELYKRNILFCYDFSTKTILADTNKKSEYVKTIAESHCGYVYM